MSKKACVFAFSGTGMTDYVISKIHDELNKMNMSLDVYKIENTSIKDISIQDYEVIGIAYPVHALNAPKIVIDFVKQLPIANAKKTFIISATGDKSKLNLASSNLLLQILKVKKYDVFYSKQFIMPSNFVFRNDDKVVAHRLKTVCKEAVQTARAIYKNDFYKEKSNIISNIISVMGRIEWVGAKSMSKYFYANSNCTSCQLCVRLCPNKNIVAQKSKITFNRNCGLCMRCIYICPYSAIKIRGIFKFISIGNWYENEELRYKE